MTEDNELPSAKPDVTDEATPAYTGRHLRPHLVRVLIASCEELEEGDLPEHPAQAEALLRDAMREKATDIHLDTKLEGVRVRMRIDGRVLDGTVLSHEQGKRIINQFKVMARLSVIAHYLPEEGRITYTHDELTLDLRLTLVPCLHGDKLSIRLLEPSMMAHQTQGLGLHDHGLEEIHEWLDNLNGMLLVAGPTGCGKTTTLYALLQRLKLYERNVVTIEDPVEYEVDGINHIQVDHRHGLGFPEGIKAMLRLDPDYLMIGEIRDAASAHAAITASASGHAIMSTLHSRDAIGVIDTLRSYGVSGRELATSLMLVVAQRLVRLLCVHCRAEEAPNEQEIKWLSNLGREVPDSVWHARGCEHCRQLGYSGRTGVFEVWRINPDEYQLILDNADRRSLHSNLTQRGHNFLLSNGLKKAAYGITTLSELRGMGGYSVLSGIDTLSGTQD